ncbi:MAG: integrase [Psychroserpens sp.]|jgi:integrase
MTLSASQIKSFNGKSREKVLEKSDRDSLSIRVSKKGKVSFYLRFRINDKAQRMCLGNYPVLSLAEAREKTLELQKILASGEDPRITKEKIKSLTLDECIHEWLTHRVDKQLGDKTAANYHSTVQHVVGKFPHQNVEDIEAREWLAVFDVIAGSSQVLAGAVLRTTKAALRWCIRRQLISDNLPVLKFMVQDVGGKSANIASRVLTVNEVKEVLLDIERSGAKPNMKAVISMLFVMAPRCCEINTAEWKHFHGEGDEMIWTVPAHLSKSREPIRRPVPKIIRDKLDEMGRLYGKTGFVFSSDQLSRGISVTGQAIGRQLKRSYERLIKKNLVSDSFRPHDSRRTLVTNLADEGIALHVLEKHLGHSLCGVLAHYQKSDWIQQQRDSYELWSKMIFNSN